MRRLLATVLLLVIACGIGSISEVVAVNSEASLAVARVVRVIEGDTFEVRYESSSTTLPARVRAYLIDAPSPDDSRDCFGVESQRFAEDLLLNRTIWLTHFNRINSDDELFAFIYLDSSLKSLAQTIIVSQGWAEVDVRYSEEQPYRDELEELEDEARDHDRGIWGDCQNPALPDSVTSRIEINELELNPEGNDIDKEWIELFNIEESEIDLSGWRIVAMQGSFRTYVIPVGTKIGSRGLFVIHLPGEFLKNEDEIVELRNGSGEVISQTTSSGLDDRENDGRCWARVPNGSNQWKFRDCTRGGGNGN